MLKAIAVFIILCFSLKINAQQLVANGSLDDRNVCTEFNIACAPEAWFFIPTYVLMSPSEKGNYFEVLSMGSLEKIFPPGKINGKRSAFASQNCGRWFVRLLKKRS